jgi:hypothetical protein
MSADDDRAQLAQLQHDWMQAVQERDMERLEEIVGPGFRFTAIHLSPEPMNREQWIAAAREGYTIVSFAYERMDIDIVTSLSNAFRLTDVWSRIDGRWQVVARNSSVLS